jgi:hypothetical protein
MKNLRDLLIACVLLAAGGFGAYEIGHRVDHLSNESASQDSELNGTTKPATTGGHHSITIDGKHITPLLMGAAVLVLIALIFALGLLNAAVKGRKRERWRVSN